MGQLDDRTPFRYELGTRTPPLGDAPVLSLTLDMPFQWTRHYALVRREVVGADRPTIVGRRA